MPNYLSANLIKAQTRISQRLQAGELRFRAPETFLEFARQTEIMTPSHTEVRGREDRPSEINYKVRTKRALTTSGRVHNHTFGKSDSGIVTPVWSELTDGFSISLKQADNSVFSWEEEFDHEIYNTAVNFANGLNSDLAAYLFANRSGVNVSTVEGVFNGTNLAFEITDDTTNITKTGLRAVQIAESNMEINEWQGFTFTYFCDTLSFNRFRALLAQGEGNAVNTSFQYGGIRFVHSIPLNADALALGYTKGFWVVAPEGTIACPTWIPKQNRRGISTKVNEYGTLINPIDSLMYAVHFYPERADDTANNGFRQDVLEEYEVSIDITPTVAPLSTANETPLQAFALV